jgi:hypothetical protein
MRKVKPRQRLVKTKSLPGRRAPIEEEINDEDRRFAFHDRLVDRSRQRGHAACRAVPAAAILIALLVDLIASPLIR